MSLDTTVFFVCTLFVEEFHKHHLSENGSGLGEVNVALDAGEDRKGSRQLPLLRPREMSGFHPEATSRLPGEALVCPFLSSTP